MEDLKALLEKERLKFQDYRNDVLILLDHIEDIIDKYPFIDNKISVEIWNKVSLRE